MINRYNFKPWILVECKWQPQGTPKPLKYFSKMLGVTKAFSVSFEKTATRTTTADGTEFTEISATAFLANLV